MTGERDSRLDPNLDGDQAGLPHPTVYSEVLPTTDLTPEPLNLNGNGHYLDLSPGSPDYESLLARGVVPHEVVTPVERAPGVFPSMTPVSKERRDEIFGVKPE